MDDNCEKIREQLPELIDSGLSPEKAVELEQHRSQCPACNEYLKALEADDKLLCEFARSMQPSLARLENITMDELSRRRTGGRAQVISVRRPILNDRAVLVAAAILIVAALLVGAVIFRNPGKKPSDIAGQPDDPAMAPKESPKQDEPNLQEIVQAELAELWQMIVASNVAGVTAMLHDGQPQSRIVAANYLATTGDAQLIGVLAQLAAQWQGEAAENPFAAAIAQIMAELREQEQGSESGPDEEDVAVAETVTARVEQSVEYRGVVVDESGRPISGARVVLYHNRSLWGLGNEVLEEVISIADGSFACRQRIDFSPLEQRSHTHEAHMQIAEHSEYILVATAPDHAFGWRNVAQGSKQDVHRIVLTRPTSRGIVVTDSDGNPLAGVRVWPYEVGDSGSPKAVFHDSLILPTDAGFSGGTTDARGSVAIRNVPDTYCSFRTTVKGYAQALVVFTERTTRISLSRSASVSGWVLRKGNVPVPGAVVDFKPNWMYRHFLAASDDNGYFHLEDLPARGWEPRGDSQGASGSYIVTVKHEQCVARPADIVLLPGQSMDGFLIEAHSDNTLVECRVVEFGTDIPVAGARIHGSSGIGEFSGYSDSEGVFAVRVLPGLVQMSFHSPPKGVYVLDERRPAESSLGFDARGRKMTVALKIPPIAGLLTSISGIVIGPDGMAYSDGETIVYAGAGKIKTSIGSHTERPVFVDAEGRFELKEVAAGRRLRLYVATKDQTLAATDVFEIPDDPDWSGYLAINLAATESASVVVRNEEGDVIAGRRFNINPVVEGETIWSADMKGWTDENGLLELDGIVPGLEYRLTSVEPEMSGDSSKQPLEAISEMLRLKMVLAPLEPQ